MLRYNLDLPSIHLSKQTKSKFASAIFETTILFFFGILLRTASCLSSEPLVNDNGRLVIETANVVTDMPCALEILLVSDGCIFPLTAIRKEVEEVFFQIPWQLTSAK